MSPAPSGARIPAGGTQPSDEQTGSTTQPASTAQLAVTQTAAITAGAEAQAPAENFPVALRLLPARHRRHLMAVYRFARTVDDIGDESLPPAPAATKTGTGPGTGTGHPTPDAQTAHRLRLLDELDEDLSRLYRGEPPHLEVIAQLRDTVTQCGLPVQPLRDLIQANRQDQVVTRYQSFEDLVAYCELSANPVGRIVLYVFGAYSEPRAGLSDRVCTALQLAEHWQDVAEDLGNGRIYLPQEDLERFGCTEQDLAGTTANPKVKALMSFQVVRACALLGAGSPLIATLRGAARLAVAGYVAGGRAALAAIEAADYDVLAATRHPGRRRLIAELVRAYTRGR